MDQYIYWIITTVLSLLVGALGWFIKRWIGNVEKKIDQQTSDMMRQIEKTNHRVDTLETRLNDTIRELPMVYVLREDFIRSQQTTDRKLDQILNELIKGGKT